MSDSGGSPFEGFTEAEVCHITPTQAVNSAIVVISLVGSSGLEPPMQLLVFFSAGSSSRQASIASTPAHSRHSRSHSCAPGLADQIHQILRAELRRGRDRRRHLSNSSRGSSDSQSSPQSDRSQSSGRHRHHIRASRSPRRSRHVRSRRSISLSPCRSHSYCRSDCSRSRPCLIASMPCAYS